MHPQLCFFRHPVSSPASLSPLLSPSLPEQRRCLSPALLSPTHSFSSLSHCCQHVSCHLPRAAWYKVRQRDRSSDPGWMHPVYATTIHRGKKGKTNVYILTSFLWCAGFAFSPATVSFADSIDIVLYSILYKAFWAIRRRSEMSPWTNWQILYLVWLLAGHCRNCVNKLTTIVFVLNVKFKKK